MDSPSSIVGASNPLLSFSNFLHQNCARLSVELTAKLEETKRFASKLASKFPPPSLPAVICQDSCSSHFGLSFSLPFASVSQHQRKQDVAAALSSGQVAKALRGTSVYTVSNDNNEFVLISDPDGVKSVGLLCFRREDAETFLAQVRLQKGTLKGGAKVVPLTLDQVYLLKVEGIAFRFLPDPVQIRHALELKASDSKTGYDGVPVFQSDLLVVKKKNKRYCPVYFQKEDLEKALRATKGAGVSQNIVVGSLEDVLKKMEINWKSSGWGDLIFIPPGKSHTQHIQEIGRV